MRQRSATVCRERERGREGGREAEREAEWKERWEGDEGVKGRGSGSGRVRKMRERKKEREGDEGKGGGGGGNESGAAGPDRGAREGATRHARRVGEKRTQGKGGRQFEMKE